MKPKEPLEDRLLSRVTVAESGCWDYPCRRPDGYGVIGEGGRGGRTLRTHRVTYELFVGAIPEGMEIDHLCRNRGCCNPDHLEAVDRRTNILRGDRKTKQTHCKNGHEFTPENTGKQRHGRVCLTCRRLRNITQRGIAA